MSIEEYREKQDALQAEYTNKRKELEAQFAKENAIAKVGSVIKGNRGNELFLVKEVKPSTSYDKFGRALPSCIYIGQICNKVGVVDKNKRYYSILQQYVTEVDGEKVNGNEYQN